MIEAPARQRVRVRGIIEARGVGLSRARGDDGKWQPWRFSIGLRPWRVAGGSIRTDSLYLWRRASLPEWLLRLLYPPGKTVALTVDLEPDRRARIVRYLGGRKDPSLTAALTQWRQSRTLSDAHFGDFRFDERLNWFETKAQWRGRPVSLTLTGDEPVALTRARRLFDDAEAVEARARAVIGAELLDTFNDNWRDGDEPWPVEQFLAPMTISSIVIDGGAFLELIFDDGGLFLGHSVSATFDEESGDTWAELAG